MPYPEMSPKKTSSCSRVNISADDDSKQNIFKVDNILESHIGLFMININRFVVYGVYRHFEQVFSYISWRSVLLLEETGVPGENYRLVESH